MSSLIPLDREFEERVYAGILGKLIGVYLGRPVEGWPYEQIIERFGQVDHYVNDALGLPLIVADDDISGTLTFGRAVEDAPTREITAADVGDTWMNYIIEDRTILWWGGYGRSTEHTAFLNLKRGTAAPASGSIAVNGSTLAEQIGAQIFSDAFAMMLPGEPAAAAALTRRAASVSHDGVALECAAFFAALRSAAFTERDLPTLIGIGRSLVQDPRLLALIDDVTSNVHDGDDWRDVRTRIDDGYGYALYPGPCHSLSNTAMSLAALLAAGDDFRLAVAIASSVGFDTDSNAGTVGCLNGVRLGLAAFDGLDDLRGPVADRAIVVSADGGEAVTDAALETRRIHRSAARLRGLRLPDDRPRFDFDLPGSVHGFQPCPYRPSAPGAAAANHNATGGPDAMTLSVPARGSAAISTVTFLDPRERMTNFSTLASPTLYPTDTVTVRLEATAALDANLYVLYDDPDGPRSFDSPTRSISHETQTLSWEIPAHGNGVPFRLGVVARSRDDSAADLIVRSVDWRGAPRQFEQRGILLESIWDTRPRGLEPWVSSAKNFEADFAGTYSVSHPDDLGVVTTGTRAWQNLEVSSTLTLSIHETAGLVARARGHRRFLAAAFSHGTVMLFEQTDGHRSVLAATPWNYRLDTPYRVSLGCNDDHLSFVIDGVEILTATTTLISGGGAGFLIEHGTAGADGFAVRAL